MNNEQKLKDNPDAVGQLLEIVGDLAREIHPHQFRHQTLTLDSAFDRDLGLGSLARVELLSRIEIYFEISLPESTYANAESPRDLLRAIEAVTRHDKEILTVSRPVVEKAEGVSIPHHAKTLVDVLRSHMETHPNRTHIHLLAEDESTSFNYRDLWKGAERVAAGLQNAGIQSGDTVAIMLPTCWDYFQSFFAILLAGAIPVPIYPPLRRSQLEEHLQRHQGILRNCRARILITIERAKGFAQLLKSQVPEMMHVATASDLAAYEGRYQSPTIRPEDIAFLQYTSGSTGNPKGVILTHENLLANVRAMGDAVNASANDVFVSWLPLYHDMGLIGAWLANMYYSATLVSLSPLSFLTRPQRWLRAISDYGGTLSASPNFGYELCLKRITDADIAGIDLSSWRLAFNGAEPVSPATIENFTARFVRVGFKPEAMLPVYGLAESTVGLAFPPLGRKPRVDKIQRHAFMRNGQALTTIADEENALQFASCGHPLPGHQIRIVDTNGREQADRQEGYLQFRGPSSTSGYYRNPEKTQSLFDHEWLNSGDLAYIAEGEVFITGRTKDIIIRAGRNIYPHELEEAVGNIEGIRKGCVVAFGSMDETSGTEQLVIMAESRETEADRLEELRMEINDTSSRLLDMPPDTILVVPPHTVLKTSSGKIRRNSNRELFESGMHEKTAESQTWQFLRLLFASAKPQWQRIKHSIIENFTAGFLWTLFAALAATGWLAVLVLPRLSWRWNTLNALARFLVWASRSTLNVQGLDNLIPESRPVVIVANHCSYLDVYALVAALPRPVSFVAKAEFTQNFHSRIFLQRMHAETVERFDKERGLNDAQRIALAARGGKSLFFFPEGTFSRVPGIAPFHMGAFVIAESADLAVVPLAIRGTRSMLRAGSWFPRSGHISITIGTAIETKDIRKTSGDNSWEISLKLRDRARSFIVQHSGEPSLGSDRF